MKRSILILLIPFALAACEQLGIEDPIKVAEKQEAEGRATGGGCRHAGRSLESCYSLNRRSSKAAIFAGWREMDGYMRENNIGTAKPESEETEPPAQAAEKTDKESGKAGAPKDGKTENKDAAKAKKVTLLHRNGLLT